MKREHDINTSERAPITHRLKTWDTVFEAVMNGTKRAEFRKNDRDFQVGDSLRLCEWEWDGLGGGEYTGRECVRLVTHVVCGPGFGIQEGFAMLSISPIEDRPKLDVCQSFLKEGLAFQGRMK